MSTLLPEAFADILRSDSTAALAALMVIANAHREVFVWATRMVCADELAKIEPKPNGKVKQRKRNGAGRPAKANRSGADAYHARQREARDESDSALLEAMRSAPDALIGDWAEAIGRSRSSTLAGLKRLREAGLAESIEGKWRLTEPKAPPKEAPKWTAPVRGTDRAAHPHLT